MSVQNVARLSQMLTAAHVTSETQQYQVIREPKQLPMSCRVKLEVFGTVAKSGKQAESFLFRTLGSSPNFCEGLLHTLGFRFRFKASPCAAADHQMTRWRHLHSRVLWFESLLKLRSTDL